ncbi:MAG: DUF4056 domain-containing protein [Sedimentisphaerales bacterium]|nr:DUF4056 domain-containing protein [Sedimentisphaerales bacterium]
MFIVTLISCFLIGTTGCQESIAWLGAAVFQANAKAADSGPAEQLVRTGLHARPRMRVGYVPRPKLGTKFLGRQDLGHHGYRPNLSERNGLVYTCKAGHIDIAHARKAADWTAFLAAKTYHNLIENETDFSFELYEPSRYFVQLTYPDNWNDISKEARDRIAHRIAIDLGQYLAFTGLTWHEIITWFGYKSKGLVSERPSAFTWEDTFSNLFGTHVAGLALEDTKHPYNEAVTRILDKELQRLEVQPGHTSKSAAQSVRGSWYSMKLFLTEMKKRNFDLGLDDGFVTPTLIPSVCACEGAQAQLLPIPNLESLSDHGFSVTLKIEPKIWEQDIILDIIKRDRTRRSNRIEPAIHFAPIIDYIRTEAIKKYGPEVDK